MQKKRLFVQMKVGLKQKLLMTKLTTFLLLATFLQVSAGGYSQNVSISVKNASCEKLFKEIEKQSNYHFFYNEKLLKGAKKITIYVKDVPVEKVLQMCFDEQLFSFAFDNNQIIIKAKDPVKIEVVEKENIPPPIGITGTITDLATGKPLEGATVKLKTANTSTTTDINGNFTIQVPAIGNVLVISYVGYKTMEVTISKAGPLKLTLKQKESIADEVVVVGYGTQKRSSLIASISTVAGEEIKTVAAANVSNMLGGRVAGLIAAQGTGEPGHDESSIFIRGMGTISGNNQPLVVINGVISSMSILNTLDQNSIQSVSVLKDAAAVAPYGMAGANGVILITLKTGKVGKPKLSYDTYSGFQNPTRIISRLNSYQYAASYNAANANMGVAPMFSDAQVAGFKQTVEGDPNANPDAYPNTNAFQQYRNKNTPMTSHSFSVSGGTEAVKYYLNLGYFAQNGMWSTSNRNRLNLLSNVSANITKTTTLSFNINASKDKTTEPGIGGDNIMNLSQLYLPIDPTIFSNGLLGSSVPIPGRNGGLVLDDIIHNGYLDISSTIFRTQIMINQKLPFLKGLSLTGMVTSTPNYWAAKQWQLPTRPYYNYSLSTGKYNLVDNSINPVASLYVKKSQGENYNYNAQVNYSNTFGKHALAFLGAIDVYDGNNDYIEGAKKNYVLNIDELNQGSASPANWTMLNGSSDYFRSMGYVGRMEYNYNSKYYFELAARYDGHYFFAPDHKFGLFPAVSLGWRLSEEKFIKDNFSAINNLKLRLSYGSSGNLASGPFQYLSSYVFRPVSAVLNGNPYSGLMEGSEPNPLITWESANKFNIGADLNLWNGLISLSADYFNERRNNMLVNPNAAVSSEYGIGLSQVNDGSMMNEGVEFTLSSNYSMNRNLKIGLNANFTFARNKLLQVYETAATYNNLDRRRTGRPLGTYFGLKADRLYQESDFDATGHLVLDTDKDGIPDVATPMNDVHPGDIKYVDVNKDGKIAGDDETVIGKSPFPEIMYGITPYISYKGLDFSIFMQGAGNSSLRLGDQLAQPFFTAEVNPVAKVVTDAWTPENPTARYPRLLTGQRVNNGGISSWWLFNGSYLRIKTVQLGYTLPRTFIDKLGLEACRMYIAANNLFVFTKVPFVDPEQTPSGVARNGQLYGTGASYPQQMVLQIGLNLTLK